jgi:hypothetical protein
MRLEGLPVALFSIYTTAEISINLGWNTRLNELGENLSERYRAEAANHGFPLDAHSWGPGWNKIPFQTIDSHLDAFVGFMSSTAAEIRDLATLKRP